MNSVIVPANPGFNVLELCATDAERPLEYTMHPVIAWRIEPEGTPGSSAHISWPITATDCGMHNALLLPSGEVEWPDGRFDDVSQWLQFMSDHRNKKRA